MIGGSFDLIHVGHVRILEKAKKHGNILVVCLNSDAHIKTYKPAFRPIVSEMQRAEIVNNLKSVDYTFITESTEKGLYDLEIYNTLKPDVLILIKEKDRYKSRILTAKKLMGQFPDLKVIFIEPIYTDVSTTKIIEKILASQNTN